MKFAFWTAFVLGLLLCSTIGIGPTLQRAGGSWLSPAILAGCALGAALVLLAVMFAAGVRPAFLPTNGAMLVALVVLLGAKIVVALVQTLATAASRA
jgi:hypothetical protein